MSISSSVKVTQGIPLKRVGCLRGIEVGVGAVRISAKERGGAGGPAPGGAAMETVGQGGEVLSEEKINCQGLRV